MLYLFLAIASSALISILMRLSSHKIRHNIAMLAVNYCTCALLSILYALEGGLFPADTALPGTLAMGAVHGFLYLLSFVLFQMNVRKNGVVLPAIFMKLGLLVPMVLSIFLFREIPTATQLLGFCIAVASIFLINLEKPTDKLQFRGGLVLLLLAGGFADAMSKIYEQFGNSALSPQFLVYTFLTALVLCLGLMLVKKQRMGNNELLYGFLIGIPNFFSAKFLLRALEDIPAVVAYPTYSVSTIFVVTLFGVFLFRETLTRRQWISISAIAAALILLNI